MEQFALLVLILYSTLLFANESFGLEIESIIPNTPAANSNFNVGDLIIAVDNRKVEWLTFEQSVTFFRKIKNKP